MLTYGGHVVFDFVHTQNCGLERSSKLKHVPSLNDEELIKFWNLSLLLVQEQFFVRFRLILGLAIRNILLVMDTSPTNEYLVSLQWRPFDAAFARHAE
jgi:hypothetical protein